jgi:HEAT repeats
MPEAPQPHAPVSPALAVLQAEEAARLTDFARAIKAAARAVVFYPPSHPAIATSLGRVAAVTDPAALPAPLALTILPDGILLDGRAPARPDQAIAELAELLHEHRIGEMTVHPGGDAEAWRSFLQLLGRAPDAVRADGGIARLWTTLGGRHVDVREIDYSEVLRDRPGSYAADWQRIIDNCVEGRAVIFDRESSEQLLAIAADHPDQLGELLQNVEATARAVSGGAGSPADAVLRLLRGLAEVARAEGGDRVEAVLRNVAAPLGRLSPALMLDLLKRRAGGEDASFIDDMIGRMSDATVAQFVARNLGEDRTSTGRLVEAFRTLVPDEERRARVLPSAREEAMKLPVGRQPDFDSLWDNVLSLLASYSDTPWVSDQYDRELSQARTRALDVERVSDDPPDRVAAWLGSVGASELRRVDLAMLLDLLRIEDDVERWCGLMRPVVGRIQDLLLVGDVDAASQLVETLVASSRDMSSPPRARAAGDAIETLIAGPMMRHLAALLSTIDDAQFGRVQSLVAALGPTLIQPLAEALAAEERTRPRQHLTALLLAFGATGRQAVERLRHSANAAVRRTAIHLLREFGGREALPDLTLLLDDSEPHVQREAVVAILTIGTDEAYHVLQQALVAGSARSRDLIMQAIGGVRDGRATQFCTYIIEHIGYRGSLLPVYLRAIETLGALRDPDGVPALEAALGRGDWWAPWRTAAIREAAATALGWIGSEEAVRVLDAAAASGPRGVRTAARAGLEKARVAAQHGRRRDE